MNGPVGERVGQRGVDELVLLEEREAVERRACDGHLEVIARPGSVFDIDLPGVGKGLPEKRAQPVGRHGA